MALKDLFMSRARKEENDALAKIETALRAQWPAAGQMDDCYKLIDTLPLRALQRAKDDRNVTLLMRAADGGDAVAVEKLAARGLDLEARSGSGATAVIHAITRRKPQALAALLKAGACAAPEGVNFAGYMTTLAEHVYFDARAVQDATACIRLLLEAGMDANMQSAPGDTLLTGAARQGNHDIVKLLLEHGADPNKPHKHGLTPLMLACMCEHDEIYRAQHKTVALLLAAGADVNAVSPLGESVVMFAVERAFHEEILDLLVIAGADLAAKDRQGRTAFDIGRANVFDDALDNLNTAIAKREEVLAQRAAQERIERIGALDDTLRVAKKAQVEAPRLTFPARRP